MSWCSPRHRPPCSSLLLMSEAPLLLFSPPPFLAPVSLPFFRILFVSCSLSWCTPPVFLPFFFFFFALSPGLSPSSPHKEERCSIRASTDMTCVWGAAGTSTPARGRESSPAPANETADCSVKHCVCVWGGGSLHTLTRAHTHQWI